MTEKTSPWKGIVQSLGLVFGGIGTSPLYTPTVVFLPPAPAAGNVLGVLSLIVWTLITLVTVQYAWLDLSLSIRGEGGTIVLKEILVSALKTKKGAGALPVVSFVGVSLLVGDGVITPAISILSAVEGAVLIPGLEGLTKGEIVFISAMIAFLLFSVQ